MAHHFKEEDIDGKTSNLLQMITHLTTFKKVTLSVMCLIYLFLWF